MDKMLMVARREYAAIARSRVFWISALVPTLIMGTIVFFAGREMKQAPRRHAWQAAQASKNGGQERSGTRVPSAADDVAVLDLSAKVGEELEQAVREHNDARPPRRINLERPVVTDSRFDAVRSTLDARVRRGTLGAYLVLDEDIVEGEGKCVLRTRDASDPELFHVLGRLVDDAVTRRRLRRYDLPSAVTADLRRGIRMEHKPLTTAGEQSRRDMRKGKEAGSTMAAFFFLFLMFFSIVSTGQMLLTSLIEERNSRVVEVLLSAVSPLQLMAGKILGLAAIGLTLAAICGGTVGAIAAWHGMLGGINLNAAGWFLVYYLLGFLLISSLYAAAGATCNTLKEAQTLMLPLLLLFVLPMIAWMQIARDPDGWLAVTLSLFPPTAPMVMILRLSMLPSLPVLQVIVSLVLLGASAPLAMWGSARIFRTGVLMYGKPPRLRELLRWVRYR